MKEYKPEEIEHKWQKIWEESNLYEAKDNDPRPKFYILIEFPYPSGAGLHVGHIRSNTAMDIVARKRRMEGFNVLYPIGWDAFGLPTENYALKTGIQPAVVTKNNTDNFRRQLKALGFSFDWSREINTTDPKYYRWTQWIFLRLLEHGLAYKKRMPINWCLDCKIGLANEEVIGGVCERCGGKVEKREKEQWMLAITKYAERLDKDLDSVDYSERIKIQQRNWIGRSDGAVIPFGVKGGVEKIDIFTTRPDTINNANCVILSPEHFLIEKLSHNIENYSQVKDYVDKALKKVDAERVSEEREKTGVLLSGIEALNPITGEPLPVFVADYVLIHYGTGAIMSVPAFDERDMGFAKKFNLNVPNNPLVISDDVIKKSKGERKVTFKLRDWIFSRQRYWGEPIPVIYCQKCGIVPLRDEDLPLELPHVENYQPTDDGRSPLAAIDDWVNVSCHKCGGMAKRETDTMPNWAGSSWYFLRYIDPLNDKHLAEKSKMEYWMPVDWYNGGMEHTTLHLLYSRFWHKFLFDIGVVPQDEPYRKRTSHGMILAEGGVKMSKSKGNVVNPDDIVQRFGADAVRLYEMFMGPFEQPVSWETNGLVGVRRFLEKVWRICDRAIDEESSSAEDSLLNKTIKKVTDDIESLSFNTAVSAMMILANHYDKRESVSRSNCSIFLKILAPFAPHLAEELWAGFGHRTSIQLESWPTYSEIDAGNEEVTIVIQINGKIRDKILAPANIDDKSLEKMVMERERVIELLDSREILKILIIKGRLVNIVTGS